MDCRTNVLYGAFKFVAAAIHPAAIQYICRTNGLSDQLTVGPLDCRINGLSDQWSVQFVAAAIHPAARLFSRSVGPMDFRTNELSVQWTIGPIDCMDLYSLWLLLFILLLFSRSVGPIDCRTNGLSDQWTVGPMDCRTNGLYP